MSAPTGAAVAASPLQQGLWRYVAADPFDVRALRATGAVDDDRLASAVAEVHAALDVLGLAFAGPAGEPAGPRLHRRPGGVCLLRADLRHRADAPHAAVAILREDAARPAAATADPPVRFHLLRLRDDELVLGVVAHRLLLDARSLYGVLGAVWQAYFGRFRLAQHRPFAEVANLDPVGKPAVAAARRRWWGARLRGPEHGSFPATGAGRHTVTHRLPVPGARWRRLLDAAAPAGGNGSLAVAALVAWCLRARHGHDRVGLGADLDLRDWLGLGPVLGPLTDRTMFTVDLTGVGDEFRDVLLRTRSALLDAVVHYLPYAAVVDLGTELGVLRPPAVNAGWDVTVHLCRQAPTSSAAAGSPALAWLDVAIGLFREADLLGRPGAVAADAWDGVNVDLHVAELDDGVELVADVNALCVDADRAAAFLRDLDAAIRQAADDPAAPLRTHP